MLFLNGAYHVSLEPEGLALDTSTLCAPNPQPAIRFVLAGPGHAMVGTTKDLGR